MGLGSHQQNKDKFENAVSPVMFSGVHPPKTPKRRQEGTFFPSVSSLKDDEAEWTDLFDKHAKTLCSQQALFCLLSLILFCCLRSA